MEQQLEEKEIVTMITPEGEEIEAEVILFFELKNTGKDYLIYTHNEKDKNNMVTVYASTFTKDEAGKLLLGNIDDDAEWDQVKDVMRQVIKQGKDE